MLPSSKLCKTKLRKQYAETIRCKNKQKSIQAAKGNEGDNKNILLPTTVKKKVFKIFVYITREKLKR